MLLAEGFAGPVDRSRARLGWCTHIIDTDAVNPILNEILKSELSGVVRYTHYSLVITGPNRLPLVDFMKAQAAESLLHAQQAGEILTGLGGHPDQGIAADRGVARPRDRGDPARVDRPRTSSARPVPPAARRSTEGTSIYLEEYARGQIGQEELHVIEMNKLLRDYSID